MATIASIRDGIETRLQTITGLRVYKRWPEDAEPPAALVKRFSGPKRTTLSGSWVVTFRITLAVPWIGAERSQEALEPYIDPAGASSVIAALEADQTLSGTAEYVQIGDWGEDIDGVIAGRPCIWAQLPVEVNYRA